MWRQNSKAVLIILFLTAGGFWLLTYGWTEVHNGQRLDESGAVVEGRVTGSFTRPLSKGGQSWTITVEYTPANHPAITREFDVDGSDYKSATATGTASVTYLPEDPQVSRVTNFAVLPFQFLIGLGGLMLLSGLFCFLYWRKTGRDA